jgi:hypothetical protein
MRAAIAIVGVTCIMAARPLPVSASIVSVSFYDQEHYADASQNCEYGTPAQRPVLAEVQTYLGQLGSKLAPDLALSIDILDMDLAGQCEWWRRDASTLRVMRDIYPPRITIRFRLTKNGQTISEGTDRLSDINYLSNAGARSQQDPLRYEKAMLAHWFAGRFVDNAAPVT